MRIPINSKCQSFCSRFVPCTFQLIRNVNHIAVPLSRQIRKSAEVREPHQLTSVEEGGRGCALVLWLLGVCCPKIALEARGIRLAGRTRVANVYPCGRRIALVARGIRVWQEGYVCGKRDTCVWPGVRVWRVA